MMDDANSPPAGLDVPTIWQVRIGLLAVLLTLSFIAIVIFVGAGLDDLVRALKDPPILRLTPILIGASKFLSSFWYFVAALYVGSYFFWVGKRASRMLWFNAVVSVGFPLAMWVTMYVGIQQQILIQDMLRQK
jgi:hypothetical protein